MSWVLRQRERLVAIAGASASLAPVVALAQRGSASTSIIDIEGVPDDFQTFEGVISSIFSIVIIVAGIAFVVLFLIGGIQYLVSMGNEDGSKKARQLMLDAVVGLVIVVTAWAIGTYVLSLLGLNEDTGENTLPTRLQ